MKNSIGENIKKYRKLRGFTQEELASELGVTAQAVSRWEAGVGMPDISLIVPIAQNLGVTTDILFGMDDITYDKNAVDRVKKRVADLLNEQKQAESRLEICDYLRSEVANNPTCYEILTIYVENVANLSRFVDLDGFLKDDENRWNKLRDDAIKKALAVIKHSTNRTLVDKVHFAIAWLYIHEKDFDMAREHIAVLPSITSNRLQERILVQMAALENGFESSKTIAASNLKKYTMAFGFELLYAYEEYSWFADKESAITFGKWGKKVMDTLFEREGDVQDFNVFYVRWSYFTVQIYLRAGDVENAVSEFEQGRTTISEGKEEDFLYNLKACCTTEVYEKFRNMIM